MHIYKKLCICGGGGLGHTIAASVSNKGTLVNLLTGHPERWSDTIMVTDCQDAVIHGAINHISNDPAEVIPDADIVLLCVPGFLIQKTLKEIAPYIQSETEVGSVVCSNGFFWTARHTLGDRQKTFGFQRVPFISRITEYGKSARIKGYKSLLKIGGNTHSNLQALTVFFSDVLQTQTIPLHHYLEAALTNSNPILHPSRIYGMLSPLHTDIYDKNFLFYEAWDDFSSEVLIRCDNEFQQLLRHMPVNREEIPPILSYYESCDATSLTRKIRSISAFNGIYMGMNKTEKGYTIDYTNRYFTEDIPYGLLIIKSIALLLGEQTPQIDEILHWMQQKMGKEYIVGNQLTGKDCAQSGIISNYSIHTETELYTL